MARLGDERKIWRKATVVGITSLILVLDNSHFWIRTLHRFCHLVRTLNVIGELPRSFKVSSCIHTLKITGLEARNYPYHLDRPYIPSLQPSLWLHPAHGFNCTKAHYLSQYLCIAHSNQVTIGNSFEPVTSCTHLQRKITNNSSFVH